MGTGTTFTEGVLGWAITHKPALALGVITISAVASLVIFLSMMVCATWQASPRARDVLGDVRDLLAIRYGALKVAAFEMQIAAESLSRLLNPTTPNPLTRLADLGPEWEREWLIRRAPKCGLTVLDERTAALLQMVDAHRRQMVRFEEAV